MHRKYFAPRFGLPCYSSQKVSLAMPEANNGEDGIYYAAILLEEIFDQHIMGQDQLTGVRMGLALEGDKKDKAGLIPGGRQFDFNDLPAFIQSGKQEHITIWEIGGAAWFLKGIPNIFHFCDCCG
jgi:hypothetical protein